jgi:hypothetical protein
MSRADERQEPLRAALGAFNRHDLWTFDDKGRLVRKDSFWKLREA